MAMAARLNLRMQKELKLLLSDPPPGVSLPSLSDPDASPSLTSIDACIQGPQGTVYERGVFYVKIQIPDRYPFQPPIVTFSTPIYHPNIDNGGRICLDILNLPPKGAWVPSLNVSTVLTSIGLLLSEPNPDDGLMCEASREYKYNRQAFDEKARAWTDKFAKPGSSGTTSSNSLLSNVHPDNFLEAETGAIDVISECQNVPKTLLGNRGKLSLGSKPVMVGINGDNQKNLDPVVAILSCSNQQSRLGNLGSSTLSLSRSHNANQENIDPDDELLSSSSKQEKPTVSGTSKLSLSRSHNANQENIDPDDELLSSSSKQEKPTVSGISKLSLSQSQNDFKENMDPAVELEDLSCPSKLIKPDSLGTSKSSLPQSHKNIENVDPYVELFSCSSKQNKSSVLRTSKLSVSQCHKIAERQNQQSQADKKDFRDCHRSEEERNEISCIVVSDSEESADELTSSSKLRLPLRRKRCAQ